VTVRWSTSDETSSDLWLGLDPQTLVLAYSGAPRVRQHEVQISGLSPDQKYYYAVGDSTGVLAGGDSNHFFHTAPDGTSPVSMRVWAIGDSGTANGDARAVRDAYLNLQPHRDTDVWLMLGDNAYNSGTEPEYQAAVFDTYPSLLRNTPVWPTFGNHDAQSAASIGESGVYYDTFTLPRQGEAGGVPSGTEAYYSFDHGRVHFVCLDSQGSSRALGGAMMTWLQADLAAADADWIIAFWHHPPYTKGSHDSDNILDSDGRMKDMREVALPILEAGGVDLVLGGHSHVYERSFLLDGHYDGSSTFQQSMVLDGGNGSSDGAYSKPTQGQAAHEGAVYTVAGSSGKATTGGTLDHPAFYIGLRSLGSVVLDIEDQTLTARFLNSAGVIQDTYVITKG
ncbi:MAG: metallophosphoesterase family protein, partial [Planctomycetes bacterium]|nr:metallophosphoesterase family protein [Planctomycetota bacterium]